MAKVLVLRTTQMEEVRTFLEGMGLVFQPEKHGSGPAHYAMESNDLVFEIYPATKTESVRFIGDEK